MSINSRSGMLWVSLTLLSTGAVAAQEVTIFESCTRARGRTLPVVARSGQPMLVRSAGEVGRPVIRYNPEALPRLTSQPMPV